MDPSQKLVFTSQNNGNSTAIQNSNYTYALPVNSRFIAENNPSQIQYLSNGYAQSFQPVESYVFGSPRTANQQAINSQKQIQTVYNGGLSQQQSNVVGYTFGNSDNLNRNSNIGSQTIVRSRMVPVTQYVPVYEVENVPAVNFLKQGQVLEQRTILNEPEAFKERIIYKEQIQQVKSARISPVVHEESFVSQEIKLQTPPVLAQTTFSNPLVQTIRDGYSVNSRSYAKSGAPPAPVARAAKSCCSPWILALIGLLALAGLLTAILVGKNKAGETKVDPISQVGVAPPTKTSSVKPAVQPSSVKPLQPINVPPTTVKGTTTVSPITYNSARPVQTTVGIAAADISQQAKTTTTSTTITNLNSVKPQSIDLVALKPVIVNSTGSSSSTNSTTVTTVTTTSSSVSPSTTQSSSTTIIPTNFKPVYPTTVAPTIIHPAPSTIAPVSNTTVTNTTVTTTTTTTKVTPTATSTTTVVPASIAPISIPLQPVNATSPLSTTKTTTTTTSSFAVPPTSIAPTYVYPIKPTTVASSSVTNMTSVAPTYVVPTIPANRTTTTTTVISNNAGSTFVSPTVISPISVSPIPTTKPGYTNTTITTVTTTTSTTAHPVASIAPNSIPASFVDDASTAHK